MKLLVVVAICTAAFASLADATFDAKALVQSMQHLRRFKRQIGRGTPFKNFCPDTQKCIEQRKDAIESLAREIDPQVMREVQQTDNPLLLLGARNLIPTVCKAVDMFEECFKDCGSEFYNLLKPSADYLCVETRDEWPKFSQCMAKGARNVANADPKKCGGDPDEFIKSSLSRFETSPSWKTIFGEGGMIGEFCEFVHQKVTCVADSMTAACDDSDAGDLIHGFMQASFKGTGDMLVEYEITGFAPPECRRMAGFSGVSLASVKTMATSMLVVTIILAICLVAAIAFIIYTMMTRRRGNF